MELRARRYLARVPPAIAGEHGDVHTFRVCCRLGRVADRETRGSILASELTAGAGHRLTAAPAVANGIWRNDRNGWVTEQITALTEDEAIEQLVRAFQRNVPPDGS